MTWSFLCRHQPIFPGGCPPSIVGERQLNYRVRDGNGCTLTSISTYLVQHLGQQKTAYGDYY